MERHHLGVTRNALRENRLVIFGLCSIGLRRHGPFISCHIFLPLCFALSGTHLGSSFVDDDDDDDDDDEDDDDDDDDEDDDDDDDDIMDEVM